MRVYNGFISDAPFQSRVSLWCYLYQTDDSLFDGGRGMSLLRKAWLKNLKPIQNWIEQLEKKNTQGHPPEALSRLQHPSKGE
jgi:hypothetical protein